MSRKVGFIGLSLALFVLISHIQVVQALKEVLDVWRDSRPVIYIRSFGYEKNGQLDLSLPVFDLYGGNAAAAAREDVGFYLDMSDEPIDVVSFPSDKCLHTVYPMMERVLDLKTKAFAKTITTPGNYHLYFVNCVKGSDAIFKMKLQQWNVEPNGVKNYLPVGQQPLPLIYTIFAVAASVGIVIWIYLLFVNRKEVRDVHLFMGLVAVFTMLTFALESAKYAHLRSYGNDNAWSIVYYVVNAVRGFLFFSVVILLGTGWSYMKPFLTPRDKVIVFATLAIQVIVNIAGILLDSTSPGTFGWMAWYNLFLVTDCICLAVSIMPVFRSISKLQESEGNGKLAAHVQRVKNFRNFYLAFFAYVYLTRFVSHGITWMVGYKYIFVGSCVRESVTTIFLVIAGYLFRPQSQNPYLILEGVDFDDMDVLSPESDLDVPTSRKTKANDDFDQHLDSQDDDNTMIEMQKTGASANDSGDSSSEL